MAKAKLTKCMIETIIKWRDDPTEINTWRSIAERLKNEFGIQISPQAIHTCYKRNKVEEKKIDTKKDVKPKIDYSKISTSNNNGVTNIWLKLN